MAERYKRPINPAFKAGVMVDYASGYSSMSHRPTEYKQLPIDRVLGTGHAVCRIPNHDGTSFKEVKFRIDHGNHAHEVSDSRYRASIHLLTESHIRAKAATAARFADSDRRKALKQALTDLPTYMLTDEQCSALEELIKIINEEKEKDMSSPS